ncbi:hypothetical protein NP233_g6108 [Leucocoprinus birnbaumii]|uniref:HNH nuclease domain-containing protein n=1 Tax=Leucocoprinus birnbaumii TaxID=56174 RepID=A0AAD5VX77_9AGAR|nr:hypothetical protein NP233_g6108 [Leucocoprinus birnbaumii]
MSRLPEVIPDLESKFMNDPHIIGAYNICLKLEGELATDDEIRRIRILGFLLLYAPKQEIRTYVAKTIFSCENEPDILVELGRFIELHVILPFKKYRSQTPPTGTEYPSSHCFDDRWKEVKANITLAPRNHKDAKDRAFVRDNWTCIATGSIHRDAPREILDRRTPKSLSTYLVCAHIIPEGALFDVKERPGGNPKLDYASTILAILELFGCNISSLSGEKVHSLVNVITMEKNTHELFYRLELYFEATPTENRYEINCYYGKPFSCMSDFVTFSSSDPDHLPLPSPELLALHATCCKVAQMSGAIKYIDKVYDDVDATGVLAYDGTSGDILSYKLLSLSSSSVSDQGQKTV